MFSGKRFALIAALTLSFLVPIQTPASADYTSDKNTVETTLRPEQEMFWLTEPIKNSEFAYAPGSSYLPGVKPWTYNFAGAESFEKLPISDIASNGRHCEGWKDPSCRTSYNLQVARLFLPPCVEDESSSCIESLTVAVNGKAGLGKLTRTTETSPICTPSLIAESCGQVIKTTKFASIPKHNIPAGSSPSLWTTQDVTNAAGTNTFLVSAMVTVEVWLDKKANISKVSFTDFETSVVPYKEVTGGFIPGEHWVDQTSTSGLHGISSSFAANKTDNSGCAWKEDGKCGIPAAFLPETRVELSLRVPNEIRGFLHGRLSDANVDIRPINNKLNQLTISGNAIELPVSGTYFHPDTTDGFGGAGGSSTSIGHYFNWDAEGAFKPKQEGGGVRVLTIFEKDLGDRAIGRVSLWSISLMQSAYFCENKNPPRLEGLLTTNAMVYNGGLPIFEKGSLSYQVGGLHYNHDGTVFKGSYDFIMRSDTARCIYGFTKAPVQVAVTVTDVNGVPRVSTSSVSESGGWLRIRARDFTFSTPTINAKITQTISTSVKNDKISQKALAKIAKVSIGKKDKVTISVTGANKKFAKVASGNVSLKKNGTYQVKIKVKHYKGTTETATISVKVK